MLGHSGAVVPLAQLGEQALLILEDRADDTVSRSVAKSSALVFTGFVVANSCSASGA
ncbi:hypothetical protein ABZ464_51970 [Streptomyces sp. NPDC005820]|uniref:hypothetical protein n=1 Tax=Streptomyces sp. NPDC005820 TaxID=3157069 RepID=UPI0033E941F9